MFKKLAIKKYSAAIAVFILTGFFTCLFHINMRSEFGHQAETGHHKSDENKVTCVDHQVSTRVTTNLYTEFSIAIVPTTANEVLATIQQGLVPDRSFFDTDPPNDKVALYIRNSIFRL